jgi:hypothetical protein
MDTCPICSQLRNVETSFYKYAAPEYDRPLPAAAALLKIVQWLEGEDTERYHIRRCPSCASLYTYQLTYEYLVNGSEDEETLTRLAPAEAAAYHLQQARRLEALRREIDDLQGAAGFLGDYIDRGHPSPSEEEAAYDKMQAYRQSAEGSRQRLQAQVEAYRQTCPEILLAWAGAHCRVCQAILAADFPPEPDAQTARYVATSTLNAWQALPQSGETFIAVNTAWLPDYLDRLLTELDHQPAASGPVGCPSSNEVA